MGQLQGVVLNGPLDIAHHRYPGNVNLSFAYVEGESLIMGLKVGQGSGFINIRSVQSCLR